VVQEKIIIQNKDIKVVQFLWVKPITSANFNDDVGMIDDALNEAIDIFAKGIARENRDYILLSSHKNPLYRKLSRVVIFGCTQ
jgi:hypothetical protein